VNGGPPLWSWIVAGVVVVALLLLVAVISIGLARDQLDVTGVATVLSTLISGIVVGVILKDRSNSK
jgi:ABC-type uncharacterized transport system permease subunit